MFCGGLMDEAKVRFCSKLQVNKLRRVKRNKSRRLRRKRSKLRFLNRLRFTRITRNLADVKVIDITDMSELPAAIPDIADWQLRHNLAYWKSKAISLEYENKMLQEHIKRFYRDQIDAVEELVEASEVVEDGEVREIREGFECLSPDFADREARNGEMRERYGEQVAKIKGMEVAVQLNYDFHWEKEKPVHWPNIPLNL